MKPTAVPDHPPPDHPMEAAELANLDMLPEVELRAIFISPGHAYWGKQGAGRMQFGVDAPPRVRCFAHRGLEGDRYCQDKPQRFGEVTLFHEQTWLDLRQHFRLPQLPPTVFRRNLLVRHPDLAALLHQRFRIQHVVFQGAQECKPCDWMNRTIAPGARDYLQSNFRGGLRARILTDGTLHAPPSP